jgi:flagellar biosynthesis/type III secretory pathway M-ring protein FliF/YscJ
VDLTPGVGDLGRVEYRVPLKLDVSRERNTYSTVEAVDNNPYMQSLQKNAERDERVIQGYRQFLASQAK